MKLDKLKELYAKYGLTKDDVFQHKHYSIITRQGIDKIQAVEKIFISYDAVSVNPEFCVVKASAKKEDANIETFGSAKYGGKEWNKDRNNGKGGWDEHGNTTTWYVMEMAEKRAMSRAVLKLTGFYELGVFGEDESEDFKRGGTPKLEKDIPTPLRLTPEQVAVIPKADDVNKLSKVLNTYTLQPSEKEAINKRIKELKK